MNAEDGLIMIFSLTKALDRVAERLCNCREQGLKAVGNPEQHNGRCQYREVILRGK